MFGSCFFVCQVLDVLLFACCFVLVHFTQLEFNACDNESVIFTAAETAIHLAFVISFMWICFAYDVIYLISAWILTEGAIMLVTIIWSIFSCPCCSSLYCENAEPVFVLKSPITISMCLFFS